MIACRYVGGIACEIGEREFDSVGQRAVLSEQGFRDAVLGRAAFITEEDFQKVGFTDEELRLHGPSGLRDCPPQSFIEKLQLAQDMYFDTVARMGSEASRTLVDARDVGVQELEAVPGA